MCRDKDHGGRRCPSTDGPARSAARAAHAGYERAEAFWLRQQSQTEVEPVSTQDVIAVSQQVDDLFRKKASEVAHWQAKCLDGNDPVAGTVYTRLITRMNRRKWAQVERDVSQIGGRLAAQADRYVSKTGCSRAEAYLHVLSTVREDLPGDSRYDQAMGRIIMYPDGSVDYPLDADGNPIPPASVANQSRQEAVSKAESRALRVYPIQWQNTGIGLDDKSGRRGYILEHGFKRSSHRDLPHRSSHISTGVKFNLKDKAFEANVDSVRHEYMHRYETLMPEILHLEHAYVERVRKERNDTTIQPVYDNPDLANETGYRNLSPNSGYVGRVYTNPPGYEVLSTGVQSLFSETSYLGGLVGDNTIPDNYGSNYVPDDNHRNFVLGVLACVKHPDVELARFNADHGQTDNGDD